MNDQTFLAPRRFLREPIPEIFQSANLLDQAVDAHLAGYSDAASELIRQADKPAIRTWTESLWGSAAKNPDQAQYIRLRPLADAPPYLPKADRIALRMPSLKEKRQIIERYGLNCVFCGIPVIRTQVREAIRRAYPDALSWGSTNVSQHAAFQCMWLQFDHLLPHCRGGDNSIENVVITCAPCNYGRLDNTIAELGLTDPRPFAIAKTSWDGLERFLASPQRASPAAS